MIRGLAMLTLYLISSLAFGATSHHLEELKSKFPYGLLSDDHGILTLDDLASNACNAKPKPFSPSSHSYQYWQCFESKNISFDCDSNGVPDKHEGVMGLIVVKASNQQVQHDYIEHRLWPIKECKSFLKDAAILLKGTQYACISGSFITEDVNRSAHPSIHPSMSWQFERIKTIKGCEGRGCDFTKGFKRENCPRLKS